MKIFIGLLNIASQYHELTKGFRELGHETFTVDLGQNSPIVRSNADMVISKLIQDSVFSEKDPNKKKNLQHYANYHLKIAWDKAVQECDAFFFMWQTFFSNFDDLKILKNMGKKVAVCYVGSDIRYLHATDQEWEEIYGMRPIGNTLGFHTNGYLEFSRKLHYLRMAEYYADIVMGSTKMMQLSLRPYHYNPKMIECSGIRNNPIQRRKNPVIVHAPSRWKYKGSDIWIEAFSRLKSEGYEFDVKIIQNMPHAEALAMYSDADILAGQLRSPGGGKQEYEGLAAGCVVMANFNPSFPWFCWSEKEEMPVIHTDYDNVYEELKKIILDYERRCELAQQARPYVEKYYNCKKVCQYIIDAFEGKADSNYLYKPKFFRNNYIPEKDPKKIALFNRYNEFVNRCDWYKANVSPGKRAGLVF